MSARTVIEQTIPARDLPRYVGWQANGIMRRDGALAWGEIVAAVPGPDGTVDITHMRNVHQPRGGYVSVPDGALISLRTPLGEHMVTVSHGADVATPGDPHPATCQLCRMAASNLDPAN